MKNSRYEQPCDGSTPNVPSHLLRWNTLLLCILAINLLCVPASNAWWSVSGNVNWLSTHDAIGKKAFQLVEPKITNQFLKDNANLIIQNTYYKANDEAAHAGDAERNGGPIGQWFTNFRSAYKQGNWSEASRYLGYCIHLIEDMNVPAHALNIPHSFLSSDNNINFVNLFDYFEEAAFKYPLITLLPDVSESSKPINPAVSYYNEAQNKTKSDIIAKGLTRYWKEGISGKDDDYKGDGPRGHYSGALGIDIFPWNNMDSTNALFLNQQLNQAVVYVSMFLLGVDRILAAPNNEDAYEENDAFEDAVNITVPFFDANLNCNDADWFKVWVQVGEKIEAKINFLHKNGDLELALYNSSNSLLASSTTALDQENISYGPSSINDFYYIKVYGYNGAKNSYGLDVYTKTTDSPDLRDKNTLRQSTAVTEGDNFWYSAYIYNSGLSGAGESHARLYLSTDGNYTTFGDYYIGDVYVSPLDPLTGQWVTWSFKMPNLGYGSYPVWGKVIVDSWDEVYEGIEDYGGPFISSSSYDFIAYDVRTLTGLTIIGSSSVNESSSAAYSAIASWSDGTTTTVTPTWSENNLYTSINSAGILTTAAVSGDKLATITASYTYGGVTQTAQLYVTVADVTATLDSLTIYGPDSLYESSSAVYIATANWNNGTSNLVTPSWSENSSYASIISSGVLTATAVQSDQTVVISATYTFGGITKTITKQVTIIKIDTTPDQLTFTSKTNVPLNSTTTWNSVTVTGINKAAPISITGASYSINNGAYTTAAGMVNNGDTLKVRLTASASYFTSTSAILTIGGMSSTFQVRTVGLSIYTVTSTSDANGSITPNTAQTVNIGNNATFTITPTSGYSVVTPIGGTCPQSTYNPTLTTNNYTTGEITANCTVTPTFIESGVAGWQQQTEGLFGGSINSLAIAPSNSQTVYAGTANGGVFKSDNGGGSWSAANTGLTYTNILTMAIDPKNNQTIYSGTSGGGVYKSINGGENWSVAKTGLTSFYIIALAIDQNNSQTMYAGTSDGIFKSTNGGGSWSAVNTGLTETYIYTLAIAQNNSQTIYAGTSGGGVFRSDNGGTSWSAVNTGLTNMNIRTLAIDKSNNQTIYAGTSDGVFKSTNGGASWSAVNTGLTYTFIYSLFIEPNNNQIIYAGTSGGGVYKSINGGENWSAVRIGLTNFDVKALAIDPNSSQTMYVGTSNGGVFKSTNSGGAWSVNNTGVTSAYVYSLSVDPNNKQTMYAGTGGGVFKSGNAGENWSAMNTGLANINVRSVAIDPNNSQTIYAGTYGSGVYKSSNGGGNWSAVRAGTLGSYIYSLAIDPNNSQTIYAGASSGGLYKSANGGGSWSAAKTGLTISNVNSLVIDHNNSQTIYAGTSGGVYKSDNGGGSWSAVNSGLTNTYVYSMAIDPSNSLTIYAGTSGGVFKSSNGGGTWNLVTTGLTTGTVYALAIAPNNSQTIYAGTSAGSVFKSNNGGVSWISINTGPIKTIVGAIVIDPTNNLTIHVGTRGTGVYKTINGGTLPLSYTVTPTFGVNGSISPNTTLTVSGGTTATFTVTPNNGYQIVTPIGGTCPQGTLNGMTYTTGTITTNCTIAPTFTPSPVNGTCGSSNGATFSVIPSTNLCTSTNTASTVTGTGPWSWTCASTNGGTTASCNASIQTWSINFGTASNGTVTCTSPVNNGATATCTVTPASGYQLATFTDNSVDIKGAVVGGSYSITNVTTNHAIAAAFSLIPSTPVNGTCGSSNGGTFATVPSANLCTTVTATTVTGIGPWSWTCSGSNGGTTSSCSAAIAGTNATTTHLPQTGQTTCYDAAGATISCTGTGQDGELKMGLAWPNPRFLDNGDQSVTDKLTGLIWSKDANPAAGTKTWQQALDYIKTLNSQNYQGHNDWRLPNINELKSLVNQGQSSPATWLNGQGFSNVQANYYWSSTTYANFTYRAWYAFLGYGGVNYDLKTSVYCVWPVRSGQSGAFGSLSLSKTGQTGCYDASGANIGCSGTGQDGELQNGATWPSPRFTSNTDQTVTDNLTGLIWSKDADLTSGEITWQQALDYIRTLNTQNYLGHNDWRLPNSNELENLVNKGQTNPIILLNEQGFSNVQSYYYWSGSTVAWNTVFAWNVNMKSGLLDINFKTGNIYGYVLPVRSGQSVSLVSMTVSKSGTGSGSITSSPAGISCGSTCSAAFATGTSVTLTATPNSGSTFAGWSGACSGTGTCTVIMDAVESVTATFTLAATPTWTINSANSGNGTVNCTSSVNSGATATCTIKPATGYQLATFTDNNVDKKSSVVGTSYNIANVTANHTIVATFTLTPAKTKIFLSANDNFTINTSGTTLYGNTGNNAATIATGTTGVTLDQNIGRINLPNAASSYKFKQTGNIINVYDTIDNLIVSAPVQGDTDGTVLSFSNGTASASAKLVGGLMKLGGATVSTNTATIITPVTTTSAATTATTTNAKVFLGADNSFTVGNSGTTVYGNTGKGIVTISSGISGVILDQNIERLNFTGASSSYKFKQTGNLINVYDASGTLLVKAPVQGDIDGTVLSFTDGTASTLLAGGVMKFGGKIVSPSAATTLSPLLTAAQ